jgi:hypothetical protein
MAYLIRRKELAGTEVLRILVEQNQRALGLLRRWQDNPRDHVHQARQAFKRLRALLRLARSGAPYVFRVENVFYRDLGRSLAYARDSDAVIDALGLLEERISGPLALESLRMLRKGLEQRAERERECAAHDLAGRIESACEAMHAAERRFRELKLDGLRRKHLRRGVQTALERCQSTFERASTTGAAVDFHAWRKEVKYASHQARLMQEAMPRWAATAGPALSRLGDVLGHYHDLVILEALLGRQPDELQLDVHLQSIGKAVRNARASFAADALRLWPLRPDQNRPPRGNVVALRSSG